MSKPTVHVIVPFTTTTVCGIMNPVRCAGYRETVTCDKCKQSDEYKKLPNLPKRFVK